MMTFLSLCNGTCCTCSVHVKNCISVIYKVYKVHNQVQIFLDNFRFCTDKDRNYTSQDVTATVAAEKHISINNHA